MSRLTCPLCSGILASNPHHRLQYMRAAALLFPGEGIFVTSPSATNILFVGDVLDARNYGMQTNSLRSGFELVGSKQPLQDSLPNLGLNPPVATPQNQILKWNVGLQKYDIYKRVLLPIGWSPSIPTNNVGDGFFLRSFLRPSPGSKTSLCNKQPDLI